MLISREADYAVRCIVHLGRNMGRFSNVGEIAKAMHIPKTFLAKILQNLVRNKFVSSVRGIGGGFRLERHPSEITLMDILNAVNGGIRINICAVNPRSCRLSRTCVVHPVWVEIRRAVETRLRETTIQRLLDDRQSVESIGTSKICSGKSCEIKLR